jgi:O-antigen/teichoic acid export membrane protein
VTTAPVAPPPPAEAARKGYGAGARILSIGIATTGVVTFAYFSLASHALSDADYSHISLLWAVLFVIVSVIYRPIEQLLSRTIAGRRARGLEHGHPLRTPLLLQASFALAFLVVALALRGPLVDLFGGSETLYWILVAGVLAYAASYFARGWLAGHQWFGLYGGLVLMESCSRLLFALAVAVGIAQGQSAVALGMAAAPFVSLVVVPWALRRAAQAAPPGPARRSDSLGFSRGGRFAVAVLGVMVAEQTLLNGAVLTAEVTSTDAAVAGIVFNVLLIARAPLQLFQAVQGSLLPHLAGLEARAGGAEFARAVRITVLAICGFAAAVAIGLLVIGPWVMDVVFGSDAQYGRLGLAIVGIGMGAHLVAGTLNQAALARDRAGAAAAAWLLAAAAFVAWMLAPVIDDELVRAELGYAGATLALSGLLWALYRQR